MARRERSRAELAELPSGLIHTSLPGSDSIGDAKFLQHYGPPGPPEGSGAPKRVDGAGSAPRLLDFVNHKRQRSLQ